MITIGYQGVEGSNSEEAAKELAIKMKLKDCLLLPLVSSFNVLDNVNNGRITYGVIAIRNSSGGTVKESVLALKHLNLKLVDSVTLPIHHFLFVKDDKVEIKNIKQIASHPQAFKQCKNNLETRYKGITLFDDEDTATAARKLNLEIFDKDTAVLCRMNAGVMNNLHLVEANLEDYPDNTTDFEMYKK